MKSSACALLFGLWWSILIQNGRADIAVIVHPDCPISAIDAETATKVFMKKTSEVNGVSLTPLDLHRDDAIRKNFYQRVARRTPDYMLAYWTRLLFTGRGSPPDYVSNQEEMIFAVSRQRHVIGYVDARKVTDKVKQVLLVPGD